MRFYRIKSGYLRSKGYKYETTDRKAAERRLAEVRHHDSRAIILTLDTSR